MAKRIDLDTLIAQQRPGFSYAEIAREAKINPATLWLLRRGDIRRPQPGTLKALARVLKVSREDVFAAIEASRS